MNAGGKLPDARCETTDQAGLHARLQLDRGATGIDNVTHLGHNLHVAWNIRYSRPAQEDIEFLAAGPRAVVLKAVRRRLMEDNPLEADRNRKPLDPLDENIGAWELRVRGIYRVFYCVDVEASTVYISRVGHKPKDILYLRGKEYHRDEVRGSP